MSKMPGNSALISEKQLESLNSAQALFWSTVGPDDGIFRAETVFLETREMSPQIPSPVDQGVCLDPCICDW